MKAAILLLALLGSSTTFAGDLMKVECIVATTDGSTSLNADLVSGMGGTVDCNPAGCVGAQPYTIQMNYNGNGYEDLTVRVAHIESGALTVMTHHDLHAGSSFELALGGLKIPHWGISLLCKVVAIETK